MSTDAHRPTEQRISNERLAALISDPVVAMPHMRDIASALRELQALRPTKCIGNPPDGWQCGLASGHPGPCRASPEPCGELVAGAADMLALFIEQLMNGPPNGRHMSLRDYLTQWRLVQGALDEYNEVRKGGAPKAVAATECRSCDQLMTERDNAEEQADKLADCIAGLLGIEIGEHSNMNDPWQNAIDAAEHEMDKRSRSSGEPSAEERAFAWGWRLCANWAKRDDLIADIGSPAYLADMRSALTKGANDA